MPDFLRGEFRGMMFACTGNCVIAMLVAILALCCCPVVVAGPILVESASTIPLGLQVSYFKESESKLDLNEASAAYREGRFLPGDSPVLNFGIGSQSVWIRFEVDNRTGMPKMRRLSIEPSWLDKVDVYFRVGNETVTSYNLGDKQVFSHRPIENRFFTIDLAFEAGVSEVFLRVETSDPMVVAIFLRTLDDAVSYDGWQSYSYGLVYGFLLALIAYNTMLYIGLRSRRYILYSLYLAAFLLLNIAYTGHGFAWLWQAQVSLQLWIIPFLIALYGITGLLFAASFLDTRSNFPRMHRTAIWICAGFALLLLALFMLGSNAWHMAVAFVFVSVFSGLMIFLGVLAVRSGYKPARYFLFGAIAAMTGALLTDLSVAGLITYNTFTYRAVEIGMMIDATLLALALAYQFRVGQKEKFQAELMARVDPLTGLNNRRAFYEITKPIWSNALRNDRDVSVILLDIDQFKQINDSYGHAYGDEVLITVASILIRSAREGDALVRWGGEEFILFLPETNLEAAIALAERLRMAISDMRVAHPNGKISFTASFGVAQRMAQTTSLEELTSVADHLLYQSKHEGRNRVSSATIA